jgi:hypothetical protein
MVSLLDNHVGGTFTTWYDGAIRTVGNRFKVEIQVEVDGLVHWSHTSSGQRPTNIKLWEQLTSSTGEVLATAPAVNNNSGNGPHLSPLSGPITLFPGKTYVVTAEYNNASQASKWDSGPPTAAPYPLVWDTVWSVQLSGQGYPFAASPGDDLWTMDVATIQGSEGGDPGNDADAPTNASLSARLAQWLSTDPAVQIHETDGIPWFLKTLLQATKDQVADTWDLIQSLGSTVEAISWGNPLAVLASIPNVLKSIWTDTPTLGVPRMETSILTRVGLAQTDLTTLVENIPTDPRAGQDVVEMSDPDWLAVDTVLGSGSFHWDVPADRYVLTITAYGAHRPFNEVGGIPYWLHRGWWAVVDFDRVGHFYPIVGHKHMLYEVGARCQGVLLGLDGDLEWTLTAYDYVGS